MGISNLALVLNLLLMSCVSLVDCDNDNNVSFPDFGNDEKNFSFPDFGNNDMNLSFPDFGLDDLNISLPDFGLDDLNISLPDFGLGDMNISLPDFGFDGMNTSFPDWLDFGNMSMENFEGGGMFSFPSFDFEMHMQQSMGVLGVVSCLADEADSEIEMISITMGGILGSIFGQVQAKDSPYPGAFVEAGGIAGMAGAASGLSKSGRIKDQMPDPAVIITIWNQDPGDGGAPLEVIESMMTRSRHALQDAIHDVNAIVDEFRGSIKELINFGTAAELAYTAAGAGHMAGQIADIAKRTSYNSLDEKEIMEMLKKATPIVLQAIKVIKDSMKNAEGLAGKEMENLIKDAFKIGGSMGVKGAEHEDWVISDIHAAVAMSPFYIGPPPKVSSGDVLKGDKERSLRNAQNDDKAEELLNICVRGVLPIIDEIEELKMLIAPDVEYLDWTPPFHIDDDLSYSKVGLPKYVSGSRYNDEWNFKPLSEVTLPGNLKASDFDNSFVPDILKDPALVDLINYADHAQDDALIDFLKGETSSETLSVGAFQLLPAKVLKDIPDKDLIPLENLLEFMQHDRPDLEEAAEVFGNLSAERKIEFFEAARDEFFSEQFKPIMKIVHMVQSLFQDTSEDSEFFTLFDEFDMMEKITLTCPYGMSATVLEAMEDGSEHLDVLNACLEAMNGKVPVDHDVVEYFANTFEIQINSAEEMLGLGYMINFAAISSSLTGNDIQTLTNSNIKENLMPSSPNFVRTAQNLASMVISDINDTMSINSSGLISCGIVSHIVDSSLKVAISEEATESAVKTCRDALGPFMKIHLNKMEPQCTDPMGCQKDGDGSSSDMQKLMKFLSGAKKRHLPDGPDSIMKFKPGDLRKLISNNTEELEMFRPIDESIAFSKMQGEIKDFLEKHDQYGSLAAKIPTSLLEDLDTSDKSFMEKLATIKWHQGQALRINKGMEKLTVQDVRNMGRLAVGLTCFDVQNMDIDVILHFAKSLNFQIGDTITSDLAECIATKIFLHLKSRYPGKKLLVKKLDSEVPAVFAAFFPVDIIAELPHCARFYSKLAPHFRRLFPSPAAQIHLEDFTSYAIKCFSDMGEQGFGKYGPGDIRGDEINIPQDKPKEIAQPIGPNNMLPVLRKRRNIKPEVVSDQKPPNQVLFSGNDDEKVRENDEFFGDMMNGVPNSYFKSMGQLICYVKPHFLSNEDEDTCKAMMKAMRGCITKISNQTMKQIHRKLVEIYDNPNAWDNEILTEIGPFVATLPAEVMQMISPEAFASAYDAIKPTPRKMKALKGDMTSPVLDVAKIMNLPASNGSGPPVIDTAYSPFNYDHFYSIAVEKMMPNPTVEDIKKIGPHSLPYLMLDDLSDDHFNDLCDVFGMGDVQLSEDTERILKERLKAKISNENEGFSDEDLFSIAKRANIFNDTEITQYFRFSKVGTLARLGEADWRSAEQVMAVMDVYMNKRKYNNLTGPELVAMGSMHCHLSESSINDLNPESLKFAVHKLGKLRCFDQDHLDFYKDAVESVFGTIDAATLVDMGVLAAGFAANELVMFGESDSNAEPSRLDKDVNLIPSIALRVMPADRILSGFDDSQLLRMGTANGGILLQRSDVFDKLSNTSKNAVFAAATGLNAGVYASFIKHARTVDGEAMERLQKEMEELMERLNLAFAKTHRKLYEDIVVVNTFNAYGLADVSKVKRPEAADLSDDISITEMKNTFNTKFLNDRVVVDMINQYTEEHSVMIDVFSGQSTLNDLSDSDWETVPVKMLQGFKSDTIQELSAEKLASLLDSDDVSRDPASLSKVLSKLDLKQFEEALGILTDKMNEDTDGIWRPPISIQDVVASSYFRFDHGDEEAVMASFLNYMCPFAGGVDSWQIMRLPNEESFIKPMIECFDPSYKDLQSFQRRSIVNWVLRIWKIKDMNAEKAILLKNFFLDFPIQDIRSVFSIDEVVAYVESGVILNLDSSHRMFDTIAGFITGTVQNNNASKFDDKEFMQKLGRAKCVIKARKVKNSMSAGNLKMFLDYSLKYCKDREDELADSLEECTSEVASRLQRCQLLQTEMSKIERKGSFTSSFSFFSSYSSSSVESVLLDRPSIQEYENMKIVMDSFKEESNKALSEFSSSDIRNVASAFGVLKPNEVDEIPDSAILDNIDILKNNTNLSRKQKRKIFDKMVSAGLEVTSSESIVELGEFVTSIRPEQFKQLDSEGIQDSLGELSKHAKDFSRAQKRAIMETLTEVNFTNIIQQELGELATEIQLSDLDEVVIEKSNLKEIGKQAWSRGQAANLFRNYRQSAGLTDTSLTTEDIRDMGRTSAGVSCKDFMGIKDDVSYDAAQALVDETDGTLTLDMIDCVSKKVHYSLQVMNGLDYIANDTGTDLSTTLDYIPGNIAMMMPTDQLEKVPSSACTAIMGNIGKAEIDMIPLTGAGMERRHTLANITMKCIKNNRLTDDPIDVSEALTFGKLMCDLEVEDWENFELDSFIEMISELRDCFYRLSEQKIKHMLDRVMEKYGDSSTWTEDVLATLGPIVALLEEIVINDIPEDVVYEALDDISPPQLDSDVPAHEFMKYDALYGKLVDSVMSQREAGRRRREVTAPTYDEMVILGAGNVGLSEEELAAITNDDFSNALSILGAINNWAAGQVSTLVDKLKAIYGSVETWTNKVIGDAQNLIKGLTTAELAKLVIDDIETVSQLASVNFTNEEKSLLVEAYLKGVGVELSNLSSSELSGFASLACGIVEEKLSLIPDSSIKAVLNDLGDLECFSQEQFDYLKQIAVAGRDSGIPTAPELSEMGTIAAGLSSSDLAALPVDSISFIQPIAFLKITPSRIRDGLNTTQLLASGAGNVAALMTENIFDQLAVEQRNALRIAAYGSEAELEDDSATVASPTEQVDEVDPESDVDDGDDTTGAGDDTTGAGDDTTGAGDDTTEAGDDTTEAGDGDNNTVTDDPVDPGDNSVDNDKSMTTDGKSTSISSTSSTTTASSATTLPSFCNMGFLLLVSAAVLHKRF